MSTQPFDLNEAISKALTKHKEQETKDRLAQIEVESREHTNAIESLYKDLFYELGDYFYNTLNVTFSYSVLDVLRKNERAAIASFVDDGVTWNVAKIVFDGKLVWMIQTKAVLHGCRKYVPIGQLHDELLLALGTARTERSERQQEEKRVAQKRAEEDRQRQELLNTRLAEQIRIDSEASLLVEAEVERIKANLWQWAEGVEIVYYVLTYCTGSGFDSFGERYFDYRSGYTASTKRSGQGWTTIYTSPAYGEEQHKKTVKLNNEAHKPVYERFHARSINDLPTDLCERIMVVVPGVTPANCADNKTRLSLDPHKQYTFQFGEQPVEWVRKLVDSAAAEKANK